MGSHNCGVDTALQEMLSVKRKYGKTDKRQGYHFIISFKKQEVRPETAMEITQKFVERYFGDDFQCLYATHDNTQHVHSHILSTAFHGVQGKSTDTKKGIGRGRFSPLSMNFVKSTVFLYRISKSARKKSQRNGIKQNRVFSNGIARSLWMWRIPFLLPTAMRIS